MAVFRRFYRVVLSALFALFVVLGTNTLLAEEETSSADSGQPGLNNNTCVFDLDTVNENGLGNEHVDSAKYSATYQYTYNHSCGNSVCLNNYIVGDDGGTPNHFLYPEQWCYVIQHHFIDDSDDNEPYLNPVGAYYNGTPSSVYYYNSSGSMVDLANYVSDGESGISSDNQYVNALWDNNHSMLATPSLSIQLYEDRASYIDAVGTFLQSASPHCAPIVLPDLPFCDGYRFEGYEDGHSYDGAGLLVDGTLNMQNALARYSALNGSVIINGDSYDMEHISNIAPLALRVTDAKGQGEHISLNCEIISNQEFCDSTDVAEYLTNISLESAETINESDYLFVSPLAAFMMYYIVPSTGTYFSEDCAGMSLMECLGIDPHRLDYCSDCQDGLYDYTKDAVNAFMKQVFGYNQNTSYGIGYNNTNYMQFSADTPQYQLIRLANQSGNGIMENALTGNLEFYVSDNGGGGSSCSCSRSGSCNGHGSCTSCNGSCSCDTGWTGASCNTRTTSNVTLNQNNGSGGSASVTATYASAMPSITCPTRSGYAFAGYYDTSAATGGTQYYTAECTSAKTWDKTGAQTLYARWTQSCSSGQVLVDGTCYNGKFAVKTTPTTDSFRFTLGAAGTFTVDCGDGGTLSTYLNDITNGNTITRSYTGNTVYTCSWSSAGAHVIVFDGTPTGYHTSHPAISFGTELTEATPPKIASIYGSLGQIFGTIANLPILQGQPSFSDLFVGASNMTDTDIDDPNNPGKKYAIPPTLFDGLSGAPRDSMFTNAFAYCTSLTGTIPSNLFSSVSGAPAAYMFASTFAGNTWLTTIPSNLFSSISGAPAQGMFAETFSGCTGLTTIPSNLFSSISGAPAQEMFLYTFSGCSNLAGVKDGSTTVSYVPETFLSNIDTPQYSLPLAEGMFTGTGLANPCPAGTLDVTREEFNDAGKPWCAPGATVTLNQNNGSGGSTSVVAASGYAMPSITCPTRSGYTFAGYYDTSAATGGTQYYTAECTSARTWDKTGNQTLYARWVQSVFSITTSATNEFSFRLSASGVFTVDWGDGTIQTIDRTGDTDDTTYTHVYTGTATARTISFLGNTTGYSSNDDDAAISFYIGNSGTCFEIGNYGEYCYDDNAYKITGVSGSLGSLFPNINGDAPSFYETFYGAYNLTSIPGGLFSGLTTCRDQMFQETFDSTGLTAVPNGLFAGFTDACDDMFSETFEEALHLSTIGTNVFSNFGNSCGEYMFSYTFASTPSLTSLPNDLFSRITSACTGLFSHTFSSSGLTNIPGNLFSGFDDYISESNLFYGTFYGTNITSIPQTLFSRFYNVERYMYAYTFAHCSNLTSLPENMFAALEGWNSNAFEGTFSYTGLTSLPNSMFPSMDMSLNTDALKGMFSNNSQLSGYIPASLFLPMSKPSNATSASVMQDIFASDPILATTCPSGTIQFITGFEDAWDSHVACIPYDPTKDLLITLMPGTAEFDFSIGAGGTFTIDWGDGNVQTITNKPVGVTTYHHDYQNEYAHYIKLSGRATGYLPLTTLDSNCDGGSKADIAFGGSCDGSYFDSVQYISKVEGTLGYMFPNINGRPAVFAGLFNHAEHLTQIPSGLFSGITGSSPHMFEDAFYYSGITSIPFGLFSGISGTPKDSMFQNAFAECDNLTAIPADLISGLSGIPETQAFESMFYSSNDITHFTFENGCPPVTYVPLVFYENLDDTGYNNSTSAVAYMFRVTDLDDDCPSGTTALQTNFRQYWGDREDGEPIATCAPISGACSGTTLTVNLIRNYDSNDNTTITTLSAMQNVQLPDINSAGQTLTAPTRQGYTFKGYYSARSGGTQYISADLQTRATWTSASGGNLYAQWIPPLSTVTLNQNNGSGGSTSVAATSGSAMPSITCPTRSGHTFAGYYDTSAATGGTQYYTSACASARAWDKTGDQTLWARWVQNTYTVAFNMNGATARNSITVNLGQSFDVGDMPTRSGWDFYDWNITNMQSGLTHLRGPDSTNLYNMGNDATATIGVYGNQNNYNNYRYFRDLRIDNGQTVTFTARWSKNCDRGTYYNDTSKQCVTCPVGYYCYGEIGFDGEGDAGKYPCAPGFTSDTGTAEYTACYKTGTTTCAIANPVAAAANASGVSYANNGTVNCKIYPEDSYDEEEEGPVSDCIPDAGVCDVVGMNCNAGYTSTQTTSGLVNLTPANDYSSYGYTEIEPDGGVESRNSDYLRHGKTNGEYDVFFDNGLTVRGRSLCSTTSGTNATIGTPSTSQGIYCWCKNTLYKASGATAFSPAYSGWMRAKHNDCHGNDYVSYAECANECSYECASYVTGDSDYENTDCSVAEQTARSILFADTKSYYCAANTYTIAFNMNGATARDSITATYGVPVNVTAPTRDGYVFTGWNITGMDTVVTHYYGNSNGHAEESNSLQSMNNVNYTWYQNLHSTSGTVTFTAQWITNVTTYDITYMDGGVELTGLTPATYASGVGATINAQPNKQNGSFAQWCTNSGLTNCAYPQTIATTDTGDKTFYAKFTCNAGYTYVQAGVAPNLMTSIGVSEAGTDYGYKYNGGGYNDTVYGISRVGEFVVDYGNSGKLHGYGQCSTRTATWPWVGENYSYVLQSDSATATLPNSSGSYCYCRLDAYAPNGGQFQALSTPWVFIDDEYSSLNNCNNRCAETCADMLQAGFSIALGFREIMFGLVESAASRCEPATYTVTYECGTGTTGDAPVATNASYGSGFTPAANNTCAKTGYTFAGWDVSGTNPVDTKQAGVEFTWNYTANKTLTAHWTANTYNITYVDGGATLSGLTPATYTYGVGATVNAQPTKQNGSFDKWCLDSGLTNCATTQTISTTAIGNKTFYAKFACNTGYTKNQQTTKLSTIIGNVAATSFAGINGNDEFYEYRTGNDMDFYGLTANDTNTFAVNYGDRGIVRGRGACSTTPGTIGSDSSNNAVFSTESSITDSQNGTYCWCYVDAYAPNSAVSQSVSSSVWVYGGGRTDDATNCRNTCVHRCAEGLMANGSTWLAFRNTLFGDVPTEASASTCDIDTYTITYNLDDGTFGDNTTHPLTYTIVDSNITISNPTKEGYTFNGWTITTAPEAWGTGSSASGSTNFVIATGTHGNIALSAQWILDAYTITLDKNANDATAGTQTIYEKPGVGFYSDSGALTSISQITVPTRSGYDFIGYYNAATTIRYIDENGNILAANNTFASDTTLYAQWALITNNENPDPDTPSSTFCPRYEDTPDYQNVQYAKISNRGSLQADSYYYYYYSPAGATNKLAGCQLFYAVPNTEIPHVDTTISGYEYTMFRSLYNPTTGNYEGGTQIQLSGISTPLTLHCASGYSHENSNNDMIYYSVLYGSQGAIQNACTANTYNITYMDGDKTMTGLSPSSYTYGVGATVNARPSKSHATFNGWCTNSELTQNSCAMTQTIGTTDTGNKTYYAKFTCNAGYYMASGLPLTSADRPSSTSVVDASEWTATFSNNVQITGSAVCAQTENNMETTGDMLNSVPNVSDTSSDNQYCWCKIISPAVSKWTLAWKYSKASTCLSGTKCSTQCLTQLNQSAVMRESLLSTTNYNSCVTYEYTITYNLNGGTNNANNPSSYTVESADITLRDPIKNGYIFDGWFDDEDNQVEIIENGTTGNIELWAHWTQVICDENEYLYGSECLPCPEHSTSEGGTATTCDCETGYVGQPVSAITFGDFVQYNAYSLTGACKAYDGTTSYTDCYAQQLASFYNSNPAPGDWQAVLSNTVVDGTSACTTDGGSYGDNADPYEYQNGENTGNNCWCKVTKIDEDGNVVVTNNALWTYRSTASNCASGCSAQCAGNFAMGDEEYKNSVSPHYSGCALEEYTINYSLNGGTNNANNPGTYTVVTPTITFGTPTKTNNVFDGWYTESGFQNQITQIVQGSTGNKDLYAKWTVCAACNAGTGASCELSVVNNTCTYTTNCLAGYENIQGNGTNAPSCSPKYIPITLNNQSASTQSNPTTVYLKYTQGWYYKDANDQYVALPNNTITSIPVKTENIFGGYYTGTDGSGTQIANENGVFDNSKLTFTTVSTTIYAKWTLKKYRVTYNCGPSNSTPPTDNNEYAKGNSIQTAASDSCALPNGYSQFKNWLVKGTNSGTDYGTKSANSSTSYSWSEDVTLTANFQGNSISIKYDENGGQSVSDKSCYYGDAVVLPNDTKAGSVFAGWNTLKKDNNNNVITYSAGDTIYCTYDYLGVYSGNATSVVAQWTICPSDSYCPGNNTQVQCPEGYTANTATGKSAQSDCKISCPCGTYLASQKATSCTSCASGKYSSAHMVGYNQTSQCTTASAGYYVPDTPAHCSQTKCAAGSYNSSSGKSTCQPCAKGKTSVAGATSCSNCSNNTSNVYSWLTPAWNSDNTTSNICAIDKCYAGAYYNNNTCPTCPNDTYSSSNGATSCTACLTGYTTKLDSDNKADHDSSNDCKITCRGGWYIATANAAMCSPAGENNWVPGSTVSQGSISSPQPTACTNGELTIGYGAGADEEADCGRKLHIGDQVVWLKKTKDATPSIATRYNYNGLNRVYYGRMSRVAYPMDAGEGDFFKTKYNNKDYYIHDDAAEEKIYDVVFKLTNNVTLEADTNGFYSNDGTYKNKQSAFGLVDTGTWGADYGYGRLLGESSCSTTAGTNYTANPDLVTYRDSVGSNCWCRLTKSDNIRVVLSWVNIIDSNVTSDCARNCARSCSNAAASSTEFRRALFGGVEQEQEQTCDSCLPGTGASCELTDNVNCVYSTSCLTGYHGLTGNGTSSPSCTANTYTVTYNANGGSGSMSNSTYTYGTYYNLPSNNFSRSGYTFAGWALTSSATTVAYADKAQVINLSSVDGGIVTLYAVWGANSQTPVETDYDTSINGYRQGSLSHAHGSSSSGTLGLTVDGTWGVDFKYDGSGPMTRVKGEASCNTTIGIANTANSSISASVTDVSGPNCWCRSAQIGKVNGNTESNMASAVSDWVFYGTIKNTTECTKQCAKNCATNMNKQSAFRTAIYGSL